MALDISPPSILKEVPDISLVVIAIAPPPVKAGMVNPVPAPTLPCKTGAVKVLLVMVSTVANPTSVSVASGRVKVLSPVGVPLSAVVKAVPP